MNHYKLLSILLCYPEQDLVDDIDIFQESLKYNAIEMGLLQPLLTQLATEDLITLQENYVITFDRTPSHSLHLFEHIHGEDRARGQALVDLIEEYKAAGFELVSEELPDYLPLFLEFLAVSEPEKAKELLGTAVHVISHIGNKLKNDHSAYAGIFEILEQLSPVKPQPLITPPIRDMDEALEKFGSGFDGVEPLLKNNLFIGLQDSTAYSSCNGCAANAKETK